MRFVVSAFSHEPIHNKCLPLLAGYAAITEFDTEADCFEAASPHLQFLACPVSALVRSSAFPIPISEKAALTLEEAAAYANIGISKPRKITDENSCDFVFCAGDKRLIKRKRFEQYLDHIFRLSLLHFSCFSFELTFSQMTDLPVL